MVGIGLLDYGIEFGWQQLGQVDSSSSIVGIGLCLMGRCALP